MKGGRVAAHADIVELHRGDFSRLSEKMASWIFCLGCAAVIISRGRGQLDKARRTRS